jgi:benzoyl-CoA reductase/2-hydroxyglutaryl-CoA dehydratase subunit BcrC/BadD/HgdB
MPRLRSQESLKSVLKNYFAGISSPLAWCTSVGPAEILRALGFEVYFPENHGALLGASRAAGKYIPLAHQAGYDDEICSYLTSDIGAYLAGETPLTDAYGLTSIPKPDLIVFNTNQCREVSEWFGYFGREFRCPTIGIYPPRHIDKVASSDIDNVVCQFENVIKIGSEVIGRPLDRDQLKNAVKLSRQGADLWKQVLETARAIPAPLTFWDGTILMAPIVMLRGTQVCIDFYREVLGELRKLIETGTAAVPGEKVRIYWEGMPIWGRLRALSDLFAENQAAVVASTYCNSWIFDRFDPDDPLRSMADAYTGIFINRSEDAKLSMLSQLLDDYKINGIIFHDSKTCFNNTNSRFGLPGRLREATDVPTLTIDGDLNDLRFFSDGQARTKIETFVEQLKS